MNVNGGKSDWSSRVLVFVPGEHGNKIVLVQSRRKPDPKLWNFPGGKKDPGETPMDTAIRELEEETGLRVKPETMTPLGAVPREDHDVHIFGTYVEDLSTLKQFGKSGEEVRLFDERIFLRMKNFVPENRVLYDIALRIALKQRGSKMRVTQKRVVPCVA